MPATTRYISPDTIEDLAQTILVDANLDTLEPGAVDVVKLAEFFGCEVQLVEFDPSNISAKIQKKPKGMGCLIQIANSDDNKRQRFSVAHEVSHLVLHDDKEFVEYRKSLSAYDDPKKLYKEVQANMLASAILMPKDLVIRAWQNSKDIGDLAEIFNVSTSAAYWRLDNLGILGSEQA